MTERSKKSPPLLLGKAEEHWLKVPTVLLMEVMDVRLDRTRNT